MDSIRIESYKKVKKMMEELMEKNRNLESALQRGETIKKDEEEKQQKELEDKKQDLQPSNLSEEWEKLKMERKLLEEKQKEIDTLQENLQTALKRTDIQECQNHYKQELEKVLENLGQVSHNDAISTLIIIIC
jgi:hypothetical protein